MHDPMPKSSAEAARQVNWDAAMVRAERGYAQTLRQTRLLSAACFFIAAALAVGTSGGQVGLILGFLGVALVASASSELAALVNFRHEIERTAREAGLSEDAARNVVVSMTGALRR